MGAAPAGAATLSPESHYEMGEFSFSYAEFISTSVPNKLAIGGEGAQSLIVVRDPNVVISTPSELDVPMPDATFVEFPPPLWASYNCFAPTGRGYGACVETYGHQTCNSGGCPGALGFAELWVWLGDAGDSVTLLPGSIDTKLSAGGGNDVLDTRNGVRDTVSCGEGVDVLRADRGDEADLSCETVTYGSP
jgi:hypothetical protein